MIPKEPVQERILPSLEKRREILERARQVLSQARMVMNDLDRMRLGPHGEGPASRFSVESPTSTSREQLTSAE
jgi:hypothetical protein